MEDGMSSKIQTAVEAVNSILVFNLTASDDVAAMMLRPWPYTAVRRAVWDCFPDVDNQSAKVVARPLDVTIQPTQKPLLTTDSLGWDLSFTDRTRSSLRSFAEDWNDPAMDIYDEP
jgi:hypothetical protein